MLLAKFGYSDLFMTFCMLFNAYILSCVIESSWPDLRNHKQFFLCQPPLLEYSYGKYTLEKY